MNDNAVLTPPTSTSASTKPATPNPNAAKAYPKKRDHTLYKPNGRGTGAAVRFSLNRDKEAIFLEAAPQAGDRQFDWDNKLIMKWGLNDIGSTLATLQGRQSAAKLFHQTEKANSTFELISQNDPDRAPWLLSFSRQLAATKEVSKIAVPLTHGEASILEAALRSAITRLIGW